MNTWDNMPKSKHCNKPERACSGFELIQLQGLGSHPLYHERLVSPYGSQATVGFPFSKSKGPLRSVTLTVVSISTVAFAEAGKDLDGSRTRVGQRGGMGGHGRGEAGGSSYKAERVLVG